LFRTSPTFLFANYLQVPTVIPKQVWRVLRAASVISALATAALLIARPDIGIPLFWGVVVPALPLVFMLAPGLWRNICPLATSNQTPRRYGFTRGLTNQKLSQGMAYPIGIGLLIAAVIGRKLLFNDSGVATAALILGAMAAAFLGGVLFKGKSGWCSSICPLLPVQRLYGQTPFVKVVNTQCEPCVGCAKNCYDFNPGAAYLADQYDANPAYRNFRSFFAGVFPGLVLGYYLVPPVDAIGARSVVLRMLIFMACSLTLFNLFDIMISKTRNIAPVVFGAAAFSMYYWFAAPMIAKTVAQFAAITIDSELVGALRAAVVLGSLIWIARSLHVERIFLRHQVKKSSNGDVRLDPIVIETVRLNRKAFGPAKERASEGPTGPVSVPSRGAETAPRPVVPAPTGAPEVCIGPDGVKAPLRKGQTLLDVLEGCGAAINAGCRAGACGADPIAVIAGRGVPLADRWRRTRDVGPARLRRQHAACVHGAGAPDRSDHD
jgi:nitrite reductase (NADH) large subunit